MEKPLQSAPFLIEESQIECMLVWFFILTACISNPNEREKSRAVKCGYSNCGQQVYSNSIMICIDQVRE